MRTRDLLRLPFGDYKLSGAYRTYMLTKQESEWSSGETKVWYSLREYGSLNGGSFGLYEEIDSVFEDRNYPKCKVLTITAFVAGLSIKSNDAWRVLSMLEFTPKSSYLKWLQSLNHVPELLNQ
jgi:hypothetical protein